MGTERRVNRRVILHSRPNGPPTEDDFRIEERQLHELDPQHVLLRTLYLSLDPYMRGRMADRASYAPPLGLGEVMPGSTISVVEESLHPDFRVGDCVIGYSGWQEFEISDGKGLQHVTTDPENPSRSLGVLGMPGFTAYIGLLEIGNPKEGETVVVAAASGAVGSVVGQLAKLRGCRVVGIAGGTEKCKYTTNELGFDICVDHKGRGLPQRLAAACPKGIDVYFENVGGAVLDAVLPLLNNHARIPVCGLISRYNDTGLPAGPDRTSVLMGTVLAKRIRMQGFIIGDFSDRFSEFAQQMAQWLAEGVIKYKEDIVDGLENAPDAFIGLLEGKNFGKLLVRVSEL